MAARPAPQTPVLDVRIAPMRRRDVDEVVRIEQSVYPTPWSLGLFMGELSQRGDRCYLVARVNDVLVGYAGAIVLSDDGHITTVAVHPDWQRRRLATRLLLGVCRGLLDLGVEAMTLEVRTSNAGAQALYRSFGFAPAGVRPRYYPDNDEDALIMWAHEVGEPEFADRLAAIEAALAVGTPPGSGL